MCYVTAQDYERFGFATGKVLRMADSFTGEPGAMSYDRDRVDDPGWRRLPTLADQQRTPRATGKGLPHQMVKKAAQQTKDQQAKAFRDAVWTRDKGRSRATGHPLVKSGTLDGMKLGEVDHAIPRSLAPDRLYDVGNGLLLEKDLNRLRKVVCPEAPEYRLFDYTGPDDRGELQTFVWRDITGKIIKQRIG